MKFAFIDEFRNWSIQGQVFVSGNTCCIFLFHVTVAAQRAMNEKDVRDERKQVLSG